MRHLRFGRIERQRNKALETARLVLLLAQTNHVIDAILERLDVPIEHRRIRFQTSGVNFAGKIEPPLGIALVRANHRACRLAENLSAAART